MRIALAGPFGSGKSELARYIDNIYEVPVWALGDYVRDALVDMGLPYHELYAKRHKSPEVRQLLQDLGDGARRIDPNIWIDKLVVDLELEDVENASVDDMRYSNEAEALKALGFKLVWVECPDVAFAEDPARDHPSEQGLDDWHDWDAVVSADYGRVEELYDAIDLLIAEWEKE